MKKILNSFLSIELSYLSERETILRDNFWKFDKKYLILIEASFFID